MKKIFAIAISVLIGVGALHAQELACNASEGGEPMLSSLYQMEDNGFTASATTFAAPQLYLQTPERQKKIGRDLLIAGGCCFVAGAALYPMAFLCISDAPAAYTLGGICSIGGVSLMGASVPLFIAGSIMYVKGKKNMVQMAFTGNGFTVRF